MPRRGIPKVPSSLVIFNLGNKATEGKNIDFTGRQTDPCSNPLLPIISYAISDKLLLFSEPQMQKWG